MNPHRPERSSGYGDFTEYEVRCLVAEFCRSVTVGTTGWGVSFNDWLWVRGIAENQGMFRLKRLNRDDDPPVPTDEERAANHKALMQLPPAERFKLMGKES
jgi:hypothetical protein